MTFRRDAVAGLRGAVRLVVGIVPAGLADPPEDAVHHSFVAPLLCVPAAMFIRWADWQGVRARLWHAALVDVALYAIGWAGFLLLCRPLLGALGEQRAWKRLVLAWNWCAPAQYAVVVLAATAELAVPRSLGLQVVILVSLFWQTWIEWRALRPISPSPWTVAALVGLDLVLSLISQSVMVSLGG